MNVQKKRWIPMLVVMIVSVLTSLYPGLSNAQDQNSPPESVTFAIPTNAQALLIEYQQIAGKVSEQDRVTSIRVFADGLVAVHRPFWVLNGGDYEGHIGEQELQDLLRHLLQESFFAFDLASTLQIRADAERQRRLETGELYEISDDTELRIRVTVDAYTRANGTTTSGIARAVSWVNLASDLRLYPDVAGLHSLEAAANAIRALEQQVDLTPVTKEQ